MTAPANRRSSVLRAGVGASVGSLLARATGFAKEVAIGFVFGTGASMDAFIIAFSIPTLIYSLMNSVLTGGLVPHFVRAEKRGSLDRAVAQARYWVLAAAVVMGAAIWLLRWRLPGWLAPGLDENRMLLTGALLGALVPMMVFSLLTALDMAVLTTLRRFTLANLVPALRAAVVVIVLLAGARTIQGLAWAHSAGALVTLLGGALVLMRSGVRPADLSPSRSEIGPGLQQAPFLLASSVLLQINVMVDRFMASGLDTGSISALGYSFRLIMVMQALLVVPLDRVLVTHLSADVASADWVRVGERMRRVFESVVFVVLPVTVFGVVFSDSLVGLIYQRGAFTEDATRITGSCLAAYLPATLILATTMSVPRFFNATSANHWLTAQTSAGVLMNIGLNLLLAPRFGATGIAMSTSITILMGRIFLSVVANRRLGEGARVSYGRGLATLLLGIVAVLVLWVAAPFVIPASLPYWIRVCGGLLLTGAVFLVLYGLARRRDLSDLMDRLRDLREGRGGDGE